MPRSDNIRRFHASNAKDLFTSATCWGSALLVGASFAWVVGDLLGHAVTNLHWNFLIGSPQDAGRGGGIAPIVVSTMLILCVCLSVCVPVGLGTAALLAEFTTEENRFAMLVRRSLDILAGIPSIVFGLFGSVFFCQVLGLGFSILSGGLTLACMTLPLFIRAAEDGLCAVPKEYRHAAAALGLSRTSTLLRVVFPAATSGIIVGLVLAIGRALAETAALVFTSGYVTRMPDSLFDSGRALAVHIYDLAMNVTAGEPAAYRSALVLIVLLMLTNSFAAAITQRIFIGR